MFLFLFLHFLLTKSQIEEDTWGYIWVEGSKYTNTKITSLPSAADETTNPGGRGYGCGWAFPSTGVAKLYLFGGLSNEGIMNDMWMKDLPKDKTQKWIVNQWVHVGGSTSPSQAYLNSYPSSHYQMSCYSINDKLFFYGGYAFGNDLDTFGIVNTIFSFDPNNPDGLFTLVSGDPSPDIPTTAPSVLGSRSGSLTIYSPDHTKVFLYGGFGYCSSTIDYCDDMWTSVGDSFTEFSQNGDRPPPLADAMGWGSSGNLYLFGGSNTELSNSLYEFVISTNDGTWSLKQGNLKPLSGNHVNQGKYSADGYPMARSSGVAFRSFSDRYYFFSGFSSFGVTNDLWSFDPSKQQWKFHCGGPRVNNSLLEFVKHKYGDSDQYRASNSPPGRSGAITWSLQVETENPRYYIMGGYSAEQGGFKNDVWKFIDLSAEELFECYEKSRFAEDVCSARGSCESENNCACDEDFRDGKDCSGPTVEPMDMTTFGSLLGGAIAFTVVNVLLVILGIVLIVVYLVLSRRKPKEKTVEMDSGDEISEEEVDDDDGTGFKDFKQATDYKDDDEEDEEKEPSPSDDEIENDTDSNESD